ncbi:MAG TPA: lysophospholipid acyltransferase family protein, partial [Ilumatobacteraceae bacterium]|nr:lysophospholipid acyltransferase family protein [Ilumatobacteraceae bacterium]
FHLLVQGEPIVMFPEGERKSGPIVQPLFEGAAYVAAKGDVPIIPVGIGGSEQVMPKKAKFMYPHKVVVIIGAPIVPAKNEQGRTPRSELKQITAQLHDELQRLFDAAQIKAGSPNPPRAD